VELKHRFSVPASVDETWSVFTDIRTVAGCFPGAAVESVSEDEFEGSVKIKMGPIAMQYKGTAKVVEQDEAGRRIVIRAQGKDKRAQGTADATITTVLAADAEQTVVDVTTDLAITGRPAQFGRGVMQDVSETFLGQFVDSLSQRLDSGSQGSRDEESPQAASRHLEPRGGEVDFFTTVLPVLVRRYAPAVGLASVILLAFRAGRRRS
jgi:carbon monoxide dehydrogenase subunit G